MVVMGPCLGSHTFLTPLLQISGAITSCKSDVAHISHHLRCDTDLDVPCLNTDAAVRYTKLNTILPNGKISALVPGLSSTLVQRKEAPESPRAPEGVVNMRVRGACYKVL